MRLAKLNAIETLNQIEKDAHNLRNNVESNLESSKLKIDDLNENLLKLVTQEVEFNNILNKYEEQKNALNRTKKEFEDKQSFLAKESASLIKEIVKKRLLISEEEEKRVFPIVGVGLIPIVGNIVGAIKFGELERLIPLYSEFYSLGSVLSQEKEKHEASVMKLNVEKNEVYENLIQVDRQIALNNKMANDNKFKLEEVKNKIRCMNGEIKTCGQELTECKNIRMDLQMLSEKILSIKQSANDCKEICEILGDEQIKEFVLEFKECNDNFQKIKYLK